MVRGNRTKEHVFNENISAANSGLAIYSRPLNGLFEEVQYKFNQNGSLAIVESGTGRELWRKNASSGTNWQFSYPRVFGENTLGSIANAHQFEFSLNDPIVLTTGSLVSGAAALQVRTKYR
jgi:hypothetical protein